MLENKGQRLWHTLPGLVPKSDWEVQLQDVHGVMEKLLLRVRRLEGSGGHADNQLAQLNRKCRVELATEKQLACTASRLDVDVANHRQELDGDLEDLRLFAASQVASARADFARAIDELRGGLSRASQEISDLNVALAGATASAAATYATKAAHKESCRAIRGELGAAEASIQESMRRLDEDKASREELSAAEASLKMAIGVLDEDHAQTVRDLRAAERATDALGTRSRRELAEAVDDLRGELSVLDHRCVKAKEDRDSLRQDLAMAREDLDGAISRQLEHADEICKSKVSHGDLGQDVLTLRDGLTERCDRLSKDLRALDRRERGSWEQFMNDRR